MVAVLRGCVHFAAASNARRPPSSRHPRASFTTISDGGWITGANTSSSTVVMSWPRPPFSRLMSAMSMVVGSHPSAIGALFFRVSWAM
jgi:hypothetical protein